MEDISDELIYRVLSKEATESENELFQEWVNRSPRNREIYFHIEQLWKGAKGIGDYYKINQDQAWEKVYKKAMQKPKRQLLNPLLKVAAVVVIAFLAGALGMYLIQPKQTGAPAGREIYAKAPLGSKTEVELSDGTKVWLNSGSEVRYPAIFGPDQRNVYLEGEAYFEVEKNKRAPFCVHTGEIEIEVLGTSFNVKSYPEDDRIETTLIEGAVGISKTGSEQSVKLKPNEKASLARNTGKQDEEFTVTGNVDTELYISWKNGKLVFKKEKLGDLAVKLERWFNVTITISDKKLAEERVTGIFQNENIEQVLDALQMSLSFSYEITKNEIVIE